MSPTGKPPANGDSTPKVAPTHLLDGSNSEAPNAAHQSIVNEPKRAHRSLRYRYSH
ncbi:hypothetical protein B0H14DRAFT_3511610 [Mycena olivaceomarginata]|nr:hypothetical protein B0H14DRAFT_3511610 [Mycena olivaceomarginata]